MMSNVSSLVAPSSPSKREGKDVEESARSNQQLISRREIDTTADTAAKAVPDPTPNSKEPEVEDSFADATSDDRSDGMDSANETQDVPQVFVKHHKAVYETLWKDIKSLSVSESRAKYRTSGACDAVSIHPGPFNWASMIAGHGIYGMYETKEEAVKRAICAAAVMDQTGESVKSPDECNNKFFSPSPPGGPPPPSAPTTADDSTRGGHPNDARGGDEMMVDDEMKGSSESSMDDESYHHNITKSKKRKRDDHDHDHENFHQERQPITNQRRKIAQTEGNVTAYREQAGDSLAAPSTTTVHQDNSSSSCNTATAASRRKTPPPGDGKHSSDLVLAGLDKVAENAIEMYAKNSSSRNAAASLQHHTASNNPARGADVGRHRHDKDTPPFQPASKPPPESSNHRDTPTTGQTTPPNHPPVATPPSNDGGGFPSFDLSKLAPVRKPQKPPLRPKKLIELVEKASNSVIVCFRGTTDASRALGLDRKVVTEACQGMRDADGLGNFSLRYAESDAHPAAYEYGAHKEDFRLTTETHAQIKARWRRVLEMEETQRERHNSAVGMLTAWSSGTSSARGGLGKADGKMTSNGSDDPQQLRSQCIVCQHSRVQVVFEPCHHSVLCASCAEHSCRRYCPMCRTTILSRTQPDTMHLVRPRIYSAYAFME